MTNVNSSLNERANKKIIEDSEDQEGNLRDRITRTCVCECMLVRSAVTIRSSSFTPIQFIHSNCRRGIILLIPQSVVVGKDVLHKPTHTCIRVDVW